MSNFGENDAEEIAELTAANDALTAENIALKARIAKYETIGTIEDYANVICWGVECVHQAKALDVSYAEDVLRRAVESLRACECQGCTSIHFETKCGVRSGVSPCGAAPAETWEITSKHGAAIRVRLCDECAKIWRDKPYAKRVCDRCGGTSNIAIEVRKGDIAITSNPDKIESGYTTPCPKCGVASVPVAGGG